eukprot:gene10719-13483_t
MRGAAALVIAAAPYWSEGGGCDWTERVDATPTNPDKFDEFSTMSLGQCRDQCCEYRTTPSQTPRQ